MAESELKALLREGYSKLFYQNWPVWLAGVILGILSVLCFAWARPWGVAGGLKNWGDWIYYAIGVYKSRPEPFFTSTNSLLTLGLLWGAFGSSLMSKEFGIRVAPAWELLKGIVGGSLMGIGSAMAGGCNVGGFFSATSALSLSGP
ncbi:MAG: YeeE/YedE thiosulfate transporter family protein, partial [Desulfatiglandales bacterium]